MSPGDLVVNLAGQLRTRFDASFAEPPRPPLGDTVELLALRAGEGRYALRLSQAAGLYSDRPVTALPGPVPALLGVAGFSGAIVPVYDLAALLGSPPTRSPSARSPRWLVLANGDPPLTVAFDELDGHVRIPAADLVAEPQGHHGDYLRGLVALPEGSRPIVDLPAVRAGVHALTGAPPAEPTDPGSCHG